MKKFLLCIILPCLLFAADGDLDTSFGVNGIATIEVSSTSSGYRDAFIGLQSTGDIIITIFLSGTTRTYKLSSSGTVDNSFGSGGYTTNSWPTAGGSGIGRILIQQDDKIIIVGSDVHYYQLNVIFFQYPYIIYLYEKLFLIHK